MFTLIEGPKIIILTPLKAEEFLRSNTCEFQRPIRPPLLARHSKSMQNGTFRYAEVALAQLNFNGAQIIMVNGQHTCTSVISTGEKTKAVFAQYECNTPDDLSKLYSTFDQHGERSLGDLVRAQSHILGITWERRVCGLVVSAAAAKEGKVGVHKTEKVKLLEKYRNHGVFINHILDESIPDQANKATAIAHLRRYPVVLAMMATWETAAEDAENFWTRVRDGEGLKTTMPEYRLREFLKGCSFGHGRGSQSFGKIATMHEMTSRCIHAWNAYRQGRLMRRGITYHVASPIPKPM